LAEKYLEDALKNYKVAGESLMSEDTEKKLKEVKSEWSYILSLFFIACILYAAAFIYTINRVIMGTVAYMRDMYEREVGDIIVE
jgi:membrane-anchored glycerophosphoryl diester phosphodiesterase (GDPDase)